MNSELRSKAAALIMKFKDDKKSFIIIMIGIVGMLMIFLSESPGKTAPDSTVYSETPSSYTVTEEKLESLIKDIEGAGRVKVLITYQCSAENIYASDFSEKENGGSISKDAEHIIIDRGDDEGGLLIKEVYPRVMGIAVVCDGGNSPTVKNEITKLLKALFDISSNSISITKMNG